LEKEMITQHLSIDQMKDSMRAPWTGDFGAIAREMGVPEAESFVARMELEAGAHVLDIACSETQPKIRSEQQSRPSGQNRDWPINPRVY
jgi:hypothetical protein